MENTKGIEEDHSLEVLNKRKEVKNKKKYEMEKRGEGLKNEIKPLLNLTVDNK